LAQRHGTAAATRVVTLIDEIASEHLKFVDLLSLPTKGGCDARIVARPAAATKAQVVDIARQARPAVRASDSRCGGTRPCQTGSVFASRGLTRGLVVHCRMCAAPRPVANVRRAGVAVVNAGRPRRRRRVLAPRDGIARVDRAGIATATDERISWLAGSGTVTRLSPVADGVVVAGCAGGGRGVRAGMSPLVAGIDRAGVAVVALPVLGAAVGDRRQDALSALTGRRAAGRALAGVHAGAAVGRIAPQVDTNVAAERVPVVAGDPSLPAITGCVTVGVRRACVSTAAAVGGIRGGVDLAAGARITVAVGEAVVAGTEHA
jgi:hypothetical protein